MNSFSEKAVSKILKDWEEVKISLEDHFRKRDKKGTKDLMEKGMGLFIQFLSASNDLPVPVDAPLRYDKLTFKPVNVKERLEFINSRPALYHSYRQLSELMVEQEKLYAKKKIVKKTRRLASPQGAKTEA